MGVQRQNIMGCSALIQMGGQSFYAKDEIKVTPVIETFPITSSIHGKVGERKKSVSFKISFTPVGMWSTALLAVLHPNTNPTNGASIYGATDVPVVIHPVDGKEKITFSCGAITKSPGIKLTHDETLFKQCEIECILKNGADWSALDALYTLAATSSFTDATFSLASVQTVPYTVALTGVGAPWDAIYTMGGIEADFDLKTNPVMVSGYGMVDRKINALEITVKLTPVGLTVDQVLTRLKLQGTGVAMGQDLSAGAANITVSGGTGNPLAIFNNCRLKESVFQYGPSSLRLGEIPFIVTRPSGTGALYSLGVAA